LRRTLKPGALSTVSSLSSGVWLSVDAVPDAGHGGDGEKMPRLISRERPSHIQRRKRHALPALRVIRDARTRRPSEARRSGERARRYPAFGQQNEATFGFLGVGQRDDSEVRLVDHRSFDWWRLRGVGVGVGEVAAERLSDRAWAMLKALVPTVKPGGRPARHRRREIVNAILYVVRGGNYWQAIPHGLPP
jgi:hypothetical protein